MMLALLFFFRARVRLTMSCVGVFGLAWRIVDDLEILAVLCQVYVRSEPRPSRRRVLKALLRTMSEDRGLASHSESEHEEASPTTFRAGEDWEDDEEEEEEVVMPRFAVARRVLDELALFASWRRAAASVLVGATGMFSGVGWWLGARLATAGLCDLAPLPWPLELAYRAVVAHPLERRAVRALVGLKPSHAPLSSSCDAPIGVLVWGGWRGAILAALVDRHTMSLGLAAAPRLRALLDLDVSTSDVLAHARASVRALPLAVASVLAARLVALVLFGPSHLDRVARNIVRRLSASSRPHHRREKKDRLGAAPSDPPSRLRRRSNFGGGLGAPVQTQQPKTR